MGGGCGSAALWGGGRGGDGGLHVAAVAGCGAADRFAC
jgi:hypothetical protein